MNEMRTRADTGSMPEEIPEKRCGYTRETDGTLWNLGSNCCWRPVWNETRRCIWHADVEAKSTTKLQDASTERPERVDGAILRGTKIEGFDSLSECVSIRADLTKATLNGADFTAASLREADLTDAYLVDACLTDVGLWKANLTATSLRKADLTNANVSFADLSFADLSEADLTNVDLSGADLTNASLQETDLTDADLYLASLTDAHLSLANLTNADLSGADLTDADLSGANLANASFRETDFIDAHLLRADLTDADLSGADLTNVYLFGADLTNADLSGADLTNAFLRETDLTNANLRRADLTNADLRRANLTDTVLTKAEAKQAKFERTVLTRTDFFDVNLTGARFYGATFDDTKINRGTDFGDHYADDLDGADGDDLNGEKATPWDKAAWSYRQIENLARQSALPDKARDAFKRRKDIRRDELWHKSGWPSWREWGYSKVSSLSMRYGESPWRVVRVSGGIITLWSFFYLLLGSIYVPDGFSESETIGLDLFPAISLPTPLAEWGISLYFSVVTFTTLGYGDLHPASGTAQALATIESFLGALLMALLVFVLGRRSTW